MFETDFAGRPCIVKERIKKSYRLSVLDKKLSHRRLVQEARCILKCRRAGVLTPAIFLVDEDKSRLYLEKCKAAASRTICDEPTSSVRTKRCNGQELGVL